MHACVCTCSCAYNKLPAHCTYIQVIRFEMGWDWDWCISSHLECIVEQLVFELLHAEDLLEHVVQLLLRQDQLGVKGLLESRPLVVLISLKYAIKLSHPWRKDSLFTQPINFWQGSGKERKGGAHIIIITSFSALYSRPLLLCRRFASLIPNNKKL